MQSLKVFIFLIVILAMSDLCASDSEGEIARAAAIALFTSFDTVLAENNMPPIDSGCIQAISDPITVEKVKECTNEVATNYGNTFAAHNIFENEAVRDKIGDAIKVYKFATIILSDDSIPMKDFLDGIISSYYS